MQQTARGAEAYYQTHIQSRSPLELVVMLYDGAIRFLRQTIEAMEQGDLVAKRDSLSRAMAILAELQHTLNMEQGGPIAASLDDLYTYMTQRLIDANIHQNAEPIAEVVRLLGGLREAWNQVAQAGPVSAA